MSGVFPVITLLPFDSQLRQVWVEVLFNSPLCNRNIRVDVLKVCWEGVIPWKLSVQRY